MKVEISVPEVVSIFNEIKKQSERMWVNIYQADGRETHRFSWEGMG